MKIIRIIFFSLLALSLIVCTGVFIFFQTFDTDQYLLQITKKASLALGRPVSLGHMGLGLSSHGITLDAGPVTIADDRTFTSQLFIKVDRVRISLDVIPLVLRREVRITGVLLQSPQIHLIRSLEGYFNLRSIGQAIQSAGDNTTVNAGPPSSIMAPPTTGLMAGLKGEVKPKRTNLTQLKELGFLKIRDASISFIDQNQTFPIDIWLTNTDANLNDFSFSKPFQLLFDATLYSKTPNVHASTLVSLDLSKRSVQINDLRLNVDLSQLDIDRLKDISPQLQGNPILKNIKGAVQLNMAHINIGPSGDLEAKGDIIITGGIIKDFNIIKFILSHTLGVFGGMESHIDNLLNGQLKGQLGAEDTIIEKAQAQFSLRDKTVFVDDAIIHTNIFELTAKGSVDQGLNMDMHTMLHLNGDVSDALVNELDGLKVLRDDSNRIAIGASLTGVIPHLRYKPDKEFRKKSKKALFKEGGNILGILLGGGQTITQGQDTSSQDKEEKPKKNLKNIFKSFLQ